MTRARRITVEIHRLVVDGVNPAHAGTLRRALTAELRARLAGVDATRFSGNAVQDVAIAGGADAGEIGRQAGAAVSAAVAGRKRT